jgi:glycosyltransferase involved in cell wall biosynthesis
MQRKKLVRITTVPLSLEKLLEGQLSYISTYFEAIAISSEEERLKVFAQKEGLRYFPLNLTRKITPLKDIIAVIKLYKFLKKEKPAIVHTHTPKAGIVGMMAAWLAGIPNRLHTVAGLPLMEAKGFKRKLLNSVEKLTYRFATRVYPNSKGLYDFIIAEKFTTPSKLSIIGKGSSNGIDTTYFNPLHYSENDKTTLRNELKIPKNHFLYIFVGRLVKDKGINELITAFSKLAETNDRVSLLLVGPFENDLDPLKNETIRTIEDHSSIYPVGYQNDVRPYFAIADALVFPSYREGFPNVVMQAGAMGLPSIVTDINGCNEIIQQGINGLIIPPKNEEALLESMQKLATNQKLYNELMSSSRQVIVENYNRKEVWEALLKEYRKMCKK